MSSRIITLLMGLMFHFLAYAQASNDSIQGRLMLEIDTPPVYSNTAHATVERNCIDKNLTKTCLVYHNDQWFYFTAPEDGRYYANFTMQKCRDLQGLQLILIKGDPCVASAYEVLQCIPKLSQLDCYAVLDSLKRGTTYLLNVDGFLGDYCSFGIQCSTRPNGIPVNYTNLDTLKANIEAIGMSVTLTWEVSAELAQLLNGFHILRESRGVLSDIGTLPTQRDNTIGDFARSYSIVDSVNEAGLTVYRIFGINGETAEQELLSIQTVRVKENGLGNTREFYQVAVPLDRRGHGHTVKVQVMSDNLGIELGFEELRISPGEDEVMIDLMPYVAQGYNHFALVVYQKGIDPFAYHYKIIDGMPLRVE